MARRGALSFEGDLYADLKKGSDVILGADRDPAIAHWISTGSTLLDCAINQGIPGGRVTEIFGPEGHGKSVLLHSIFKQAQLRGGIAILIATEPFSEGLAYNIMGVRREGPQFILKHTNCAETTVQALEFYIERCRGCEVPVVIGIDSIACLQPKDDQDVAWDDDPRLSGMARIWNRYFSRKSTINLLGENIFVVMVNQVRDQMSIGGGRFKKMQATPVEDWNTPGGRSLKHAFHVRLQVTRTGMEYGVGDDNKSNGIVIGNRVQVKTVKNKTGPFPRKIVYPFYNQMTYPVLGIDDGRSCIDYLLEQKMFSPWINPKTGKSPAGKWEFCGVNGTDDDLWRAFHSDVTGEFAQAIRNYTTSVFLKHHGQID